MLRLKIRPTEVISRRRFVSVMYALLNNNIQGLLYKMYVTPMIIAAFRFNALSEINQIQSSSSHQPQLVYHRVVRPLSVTHCSTCTLLVAYRNSQTSPSTRAKSCTGSPFSSETNT